MPWPLPRRYTVPPKEAGICREFVNLIMFRQVCGARQAGGRGADRGDADGAWEGGVEEGLQ